MRNQVTEVLSKRRLKDKGEVLGGRCRKLDIYGKPVRLTFKGADTYQTSIGATVTILAGLAVISFGLWSWLSGIDTRAIIQQSMH